MHETLIFFGIIHLDCSPSGYIFWVYQNIRHHLTWRYSSPQDMGWPHDLTIFGFRWQYWWWQLIRHAPGPTHYVLYFLFFHHQFICPSPLFLSNNGDSRTNVPLLIFFFCWCVDATTTRNHLIRDGTNSSWITKKPS